MARVALRFYIRFRVSIFVMYSALSKIEIKNSDNRPIEIDWP